jgi:transposase
MPIEEDGASRVVGRRRRSWTGDEKRRIVGESLAAGASIAEVARRHDLNANQLVAWRRQLGVQLRIPTKPDTYSNMKPDAYSNMKPDTVSDLMPDTGFALPDLS